MQLQGFDHIAFPVPDIEKSERWYCAVLNGRVKQRTGWDPRDIRGSRTRQIWIEVGDAIVNLVEGPSMNRPDDVHFYHYAFTADANDLDAWMEHLRSQNVEILGPYGHGGAKTVSLYFDDPDNYRLELSFEFADFETAKAEALKRGGKLGNPVAAYSWE